MSTFENWAKQNLGVDEDGNIFFWRQKLSGRVRSAIGFTEFEECWQAAFLAGQKSKAATLKLPERRIDNPEDMQWTAMETQGWNDCLDAVKALNEGDV